MKDKKIPYLIEPNLTPENAVEKGYRYVGDVIDPYQAVLDLLELAKSQGYTFGAPTKKNDSKCKIGLYHKDK